MFNAGFTISKDTETVMREIRELVKEKGFKLDKSGKDMSGTIHTKGVNRSKLSVFKKVFRKGHETNKEAQRAGIHMIAMQGEDGNSFVFISVYPVMELYNLPEIPNVTQSSKERETDEILCKEIIEDISDSINEKIPKAEEKFRTMPFEKTYELEDSKNQPRKNTEDLLKKILERNNFTEIKKKTSKYNTVVEIIARNKSFFKTAKEHIIGRNFSKYLGDVQNVSVRCLIEKTKLGLDHRMKVKIKLYPSMEFLEMEEIPGLSQEIDEEMTDAAVCSDIWELLIQDLDKEFS